MITSTMQMAGLDEVIENVILSKIEKHGGIYYMTFTWRNNIWGQLIIPEYECNPKELKLYCRVNDKMKGKLVRYQAKYYKTYEFIPI